MIFHTIYTITIGRFAEMLEIGDINYCKRLPIWLPKKIVKKYHNKLLVEYNKISNKNKIKELISDDFDKIAVNYEIKYYELIERLIGIWYQLDGIAKKNVRNNIDEMYFKKFGINPDEKDFINVVNKRKLLIEKAQQVFAEPKENKEYSFEDDIRKLERILIPITIRDKKLYLLSKYIDDAVRLSNQNKQ